MTFTGHPTEHVQIQRTKSGPAVPRRCLQPAALQLACGAVPRRLPARNELLADAGMERVLQLLQHAV